MSLQISGVYIITNIVTQKVYIGCSQNIDFRWHTHRNALRCNRHINNELQADCNKNGLESLD